MSGREIYLMCDYGTQPVWWAENGVGGSVDELPLSAETRSQLLAWAARYESGATDDREWASDRELDEFEAEGIRLWGLVRSELGSEWRVGYHSEIEGRRVWDPDELPT